MNMKTKRLPTKLSALLRLAVKDAKKIAQKKGYQLDMANWHHPFLGKCYVCMAGAVIAIDLGAKPTNDVDPYNFPPAVKEALQAIDSMRCGDFEDACLLTQVSEKSLSSRKRVAIVKARHLILKDLEQSRGDRALWSTYLKAAKVLGKAGL